MTEFPVATSPSLDAAPEVLDYTVGTPVPGVSVRVVDGRENEFPVGREGELRLKGPQCFLGYADASLDAAAFDEDGWLRTGDLGLIDADGNVRVTGRIKDAIIRNAENISALEIETCSPPIPPSPMLPSSECPTTARGSGCAPSWYPPRPTACHWNPWCGTVIRWA